MSQRFHVKVCSDEGTGRRRPKAPSNLCVSALAALSALAFCASSAHAQSGNTAGHGTRDTSAREARQEKRGDPAEEVQRAVERLFDEPMGGMLVNRTVTVLGKDFYRYFSNTWRYSDQSSRYSISIHERPTARFGSEIWILYRQQRIFHTFLPPARAATRELSELAVDQVLERIVRMELERFTTPDPDLGPEEL